MRSLFVSLLIVFIFYSCDKIDIEKTHKTHLLVKDKWVMKSYVDYETNISYETSKAKLKFEKDGKYIIYPDADSIPRFSNWEFDEDCNYITIGSNTFKLETLTKKLLGLNYGTVRIYYVHD